jgi:iron(III) transport system ATP-binding protein
MHHSGEAAYLCLDKIGLSFGQVPVVHEVSLRVMPGEITCLLGPSGCGRPAHARKAQVVRIDSAKKLLS